MKKYKFSESTRIFNSASDAQDYAEEGGHINAQIEQFECCEYCESEATHYFARYKKHLCNDCYQTEIQEQLSEKRIGIRDWIFRYSTAKTNVFIWFRENKISSDQFMHMSGRLGRLLIGKMDWKGNVK